MVIVVPVRLLFVALAFSCFAATGPDADSASLTAHRLNRAEYNYSVHDLLGVDFQPAADFPQDDSGFGFDNIASALSLSPLLMERYLNAAETVARAAVFGARPSTAAGAVYLNSRHETWLFPWPDYDRTGLSLTSSLHVRQMFPLSAEYRFAVTIEGEDPSKTPLTLGVWIDGRLLAQANASPGTFNGRRVELRGVVAAGEHTVSVSWLDAAQGLTSDRPLTAYARSVEIGGPFDTKAGPSTESLKLVYACGHLDGHHTSECPRIIVSALARRAFRRPVTERETGRLLGLVSQTLEKGGSFEEGISAALEAILVSPNFLFRLEPGGAAKPGLQSAKPLELASRLSYFLWSSVPDEELLHAAETGSLNQPGVVTTQVRRMLADSKSSRLAENFGGQWLETRRLETVKPDARTFPQFDDYLRFSMQRESRLFFENLIREDGSILDFLDARYAFLNERMARFYGIHDVTGPEFRKVDLTGTPRTGVFTQAAVLTVSSYPSRTSPVLRGKWILSNLLNTPPAPPPPDVPNLSEAAIGKSASLRAQMEAHRANPVCAGCHAMMDPLGFSLEHFNAIGQWRVADGNFPIDASGKLPDGRTFDGSAGLSAILAAKPDAFGRCFTEKLLTYALGRGLEPSDEAAVNAIVARAARDRYRLGTIVLEIAGSAPFQLQATSMRKSDEGGRVSHP